MHKKRDIVVTGSSHMALVMRKFGRFLVKKYLGDSDHFFGIHVEGQGESIFCYTSTQRTSSINPFLPTRDIIVGGGLLKFKLV